MKNGKTETANTETAAPPRGFRDVLPTENFLRAAVGPDRPTDQASARELERRYGLDFTPSPTG